MTGHSRRGVAHGRQPDGTLRIAMVGTRGVPAAYGGFETAVEEIGSRLAARGHEVTVYCRRTAAEQPAEHLGMRLVHLPAVRKKVLETLSHTALSVLHMAVTRRNDVAFVFNAANAPFVPVIRAKGVPTAVHVDGLEWKRAKWSGSGKRYYRWAEERSVRTADALIADAAGIADYYEQQFSVPTELLTYGAKILEHPRTDLLGSGAGVEAGAFHLVVARFEPENHVDLIVEGFIRSAARHPLVVVGSAPYGAEHSERIAALAASDPRVHLLGGVWDQELLDQLYAGALTYVHGHSVGGTNPSLLRAMGAGTAVIGFDSVFNHEVVGDSGSFFAASDEVARLIEQAELDEAGTAALGAALQVRAAEVYRWDSIADGYEALALRLADGATIHGTGRFTRLPIDWNPKPVSGINPTHVTESTGGLA
ncbi:DUF1972 domain-containing protein [Plantibacter sp. VKM Ac-2876]|uniref:DUF1972 domain-containing protein n=1 Tax=Plantibacter sp. VKM Ac-2876 TaxID=2783826 RepID=UPI00188B6D62|nr:DUF1972 domain-containing protein [Plantibacter sp. VKM Ac-2876]MBF4563543.1 DUF1972 domain-containing protein [Plantibacter sp. VKM Ac-2876]